MSEQTVNEQTPRRRDEGFSLIELLATTLLLGLVLAVVVAIYASTSQVERTVNSVTTSATEAQLAATSIERGVRSASEVHLGGVDSSLLVARVPGSAATISWSCVAWYFSDGGDGKLYSRTFADGTVVAEPDLPRRWPTGPCWSKTSRCAAAPPSSRRPVAQITVSFDATADDHLPSPSISPPSR